LLKKKVKNQLSPKMQRKKKTKMGMMGALEMKGQLPVVHPLLSLKQVQFMELALNTLKLFRGMLILFVLARKVMHFLNI